MQRWWCIAEGGCFVRAVVGFGVGLDSNGWKGFRCSSSGSYSITMSSGSGRSVLISMTRESSCMLM